MEKNEKLLAQILNDSDEMIQVSHANTFSMIYANETARKYTGHGDEPYLGRHCYEYMMGLKEQCSFCPMRNLGDRNSFETEVDNGKEVYAVKTKKILWEGEEVFIEYAWDVTKIRRSQQIYKSQIKALLASIPHAQGIFHMDLTEDKVISVNGSASLAIEMRKLSKVNEVIKAVSQCVPGEEGALDFYYIFCKESLLKAYENGKTELVKDTDSYFDDGSIRPARITARLIINPDNNHLECIVYGLDVSLEVQARRKYEKERENLLAIFDTLADSYANVLLIDAEHKQIKPMKVQGAVNAIFSKGRDLFYDFENVKNLYVEKRVHPKDRKMMAEALSLNTIRKNLEEAKEYKGNYSVIEDGQAHFFQFKFSRPENMEYIVGGFQNTDEIVAKQIEQEKALRDALVMARQANHAKTTFLSNMSHDIRTPMNAIIGFTALAQTHLDHPDQVEDYLKKIHTSSAHLLGLINEILDMSRIESGIVKLEENQVNLPGILRDLHGIIQGQIDEKKQRLLIETFELTHEDVVTDKLRLNQVLLNIVGNAIKYTDIGGTIRVGMTEKTSDRPGYAGYEFSIRDNGIGMSPEFADHIFDAFAREHTSTVSGIQGTGLGMAIAKNIVDLMDGQITVKSKLGKGTEVLVRVDLKIGEGVADETPDQALISHESFRGKRILLVEDNDLNREIARTILEDAGIIVDTAEDGIEAVDLMSKATEEEYDLILMDIQMPKMDGYTATREIRTLKNNRKANIPIVAMTANAFEEDRKKSLEAGMNGHIAKPIDIDILSKMLDQMFEKEKSKNIQ